MLRSAIFGLLFAGLCAPALLVANELPSGDDIAQNVNARDEGVAVARNLVMEMTDRRGKTRTRATRGFRKYFGDEKRTAIFYLEPRNIKDTAYRSGRTMSSRIPMQDCV